MNTDLDLTPISVGFDLRLHDMIVKVPKTTTSAKYDERRGKLGSFEGRARPS